MSVDSVVSSEMTPCAACAQRRNFWGGRESGHPHFLEGGWTYFL